MIRYFFPKNWIHYDRAAISDHLANAKATILCLQTLRYQRRWVDELQRIELKREVAGTSRIEGAEFTDRELEEAIKKTPQELHARSQKQVAAAMQTYRWIAQVQHEQPINADLICYIHRLIVTGADDDHCPPGRIRRQNENVNFGVPRHRGAEGGDECQEAFTAFVQALLRDFQDHDMIIQAIAAHYHFAAMHPFLDGNGRTARALEALMLQRAGLRDSSFIAMSNYYYDEKQKYLAALAEVREREHDLTPFLLFALDGVASQSKRLLDEIQRHISKAVFKDLMLELFGRLTSPRKRALAERHMDILNQLLAADGPTDYFQFARSILSAKYSHLRNPSKAMMRDLTQLHTLGAIEFQEVGDERWNIGVNLDWPTKITESEFFNRLKELPRAKTLSFLY